MAGRVIGGLILEVKGDFCGQVRSSLGRHGRGDDYVESASRHGTATTPMYSDLDAYVLAHGIATLMTNLSGRGKEPFWQRVSTNVVKFVILLHQTLDDYVTLFQVYEHVISRIFASWNHLDEWLRQAEAVRLRPESRPRVRL
jgi:hypothetical protein